MVSAPFIADAFIDHVKQVYERIACVRRTKENVGNLISVVQFLIILVIFGVALS